MDPLEPFVKQLQEEPWLDIPRDTPETPAPPQDAPLQFESQTSDFQGLPEPESFQEWGDPSVTIRLPDYCIDGLLPVGGKMILGGGSKSFKTWQLIDLGLSVAHGVPWMGLNTERSKVLYLDLEFIPAFFKKRVGVAEAKGLGPTDNFHVWHLRGIEYNPSVLLQVMQSWETFEEYKLIIIDPFYKMNAGGDENANGEVTDLLLKIERFAKSSAVVFAHHFAKGDMGGRDPIDRCAGAGSFARDPDAILSCTRHEVKHALTIDVSVRNDKPIDPFVVRFDTTLLHMVHEPDLDPDKLHKPGQPFKDLDEAKAGSAKTIENLALQCGDKSMTRGELLIVAENIGWSRYEFDEALKDKTEVEKYFFYETKGRSSTYTKV